MARRFCSRPLPISKLIFIRLEHGVYVRCNSLTIGEHSTPIGHGSISGLGPVWLIDRLASGDQFAKIQAERRPR
jgi:hypothetical protein